jgi:hypothetical protein
LPARIVITPLTELTGPIDKAGNRQVRVYLQVLDEFGSEMKFPGVFRFELYQMIRRSGEPRGARLAVWPDFDLNDPAVNHRYWQEMLRMYCFTLDLALASEGPFVLECTLLCPDGRRLSSQYVLGIS